MEHGSWRVPSTTFVLTEKYLPQYMGDDVFVRPCPKRPRHGFVDSRICTTLAEVRAVWEEARAADPEAELMIMTPIDAVCSAILAGGRLAIGPGHDGATGGHGVQELRVIPLAWDAWLLSSAGVESAESAYLELVHGTMPGMGVSRRTYAVQLRSGPALPASRDYIPATTTVTAIVTPHDDLQRWEAEVPTFAPGTVVVAPGGSLASHAAVHCVLHGVPFVTTFEPAVGQTIEAIAETPFALDTDAFMRGGAAADTQLGINRDSASHVCKLAVVILHQWAALRTSGSDVASRLLGFACRTLARSGAAICAGEARHYSLKQRCQRPSKVGRTARIESTLRATPTAQRRALTMAGRAFGLPGWSSGFGGSAWIECASAVDRLWRAQAADKLCESDLVAALNRVINVAHNNGALLNKLVDSGFLNGAASDPTRKLVDSMATLYSVLVASAEAKAAVKLPRGGRIVRPEPTTYSKLHVHVEPSGIKAQLWNTSTGGYVSHHTAWEGPEILAWISAQDLTSRSRYGSSSRYYVPIPLAKPIKASDSAIVDAIKRAMGGA